MSDAADAMPLDYRDHPPMVWLRGESGAGLDVYVSEWLRDRAAGVGTKNGADDE